SGRGCKGRPKTALAYAPEVVLHPVHEGDRNLVPVLPHVRLRQRDVALLPGDAEVIGYPPDDLARVIAQMAAGPTEQGNPRGHVTYHRDAGRGSAAARALPLACGLPGLACGYRCHAR